MYKYLALGIIAIAGIMAIPMSLETQDDTKAYGYVTLVLRDSAGQPVFQQIVHNILLGIGEDYMLSQSFNNGTDSEFITEANGIDALCVTAETGFAENETNTAQTFFANDELAGTFSCKTLQFTISNLAGVSTAVSEAAIFNETGSNPNIGTGNTITGIGVCSDQNASTDGFGFQESFNTGCSTTATASPLIAEVDTSDITLEAGETVTITYTLTLD